MEDIFYLRHSTREFLSREIEKEKIIEILDAGCYAPSSKNRQPWKFLVYSGELKEQGISIFENVILKKKENNIKIPYGYGSVLNSIKIMHEAPHIIYVINECSENDLKCISTDILSIGAAVENILLKATTLGIASICLGDIRYAYDEMKKFLNEKNMLVCAIALGYERENKEVISKTNRKKAYNICI